MRAGQVNQLTVHGEGSRYTFFVNGTQVPLSTRAGRLVDSDLSRGSAGLVVEAERAGDSFTYEFGQVEVWAP
jgi:hypothetical protein